MSAPGQGGRDGSDQVWGLISTLVAGPAVWGGIGYGVDRLTDLEVFLPIGVVVGFVTSFYVVYARTRDTPDTADTGTDPVRPAPRPDARHPHAERPDAERPDTGDDAPA